MRVKRTLYKQRCFIELRNGYKGSSRQMAALIGCTKGSAQAYMLAWKNMTEEERSAAYKRSVKAVNNMDTYGLKPKTMYKQQIIIRLYQNLPGDMCEILGCKKATLRSYINEWKRMTDAQKKEAYRQALKDMKEYEKEYKEVKEPEKPKPVETMDGFRTPYNVLKQKRSRMFISRY